MDYSLLPKIEKYENGQEASKYGAFCSSSFLKFRVFVPRTLGVSTPILRIKADGGSDRDIWSEFVTTDYKNDLFEVSFRPCDVLPDDCNLLFYTFVFPNGRGAYFTNTFNNFDFVLSEVDRERFALSTYDEGFETPDWIKGGVMYHIFVDRFRKGEGKTEKRDDSVMNDDWESGVPQYAKKVGDRLSNNVFFGGNLWGVSEKLPYLAGLGVNTIYLSPIFEAYSNHKYDTGDYMKIDGGFGGEAAFENLLKKAKKQGIRVILDGVFNHTGDNSVYFDKYGKYGGGAYKNAASAYREWFRFGRNEDEYESWWGIDILPRLNHKNEKCRRFFTDAEGVGGKYIEEGACGWRLDVADELNDDFLDEFRRAVKGKSRDAVIIGEVWENAATKIAYGERRRYFSGRQLDSVMNYPFRNAVINFAVNGDAETFYNTLTEIYSSYPRCVSDCLMNIVGTHDTERILTVLGGDTGEGLDNDALAVKKMSEKERERAKRRLKFASALQYTVYGFPSVFYGDEAGMEGYHDPFCRRPFPWGREDVEIREHYEKLGAIRRRHKAFDGGEFEFIERGKNHVIYERKKGGDRIVVVANAGKEIEVSLPGKYRDALSGKTYDDNLTAESESVLLLEEIK